MALARTLKQMRDQRARRKRVAGSAGPGGRERCASAHGLRVVRVRPARAGARRPLPAPAGSWRQLAHRHGTRVPGSDGDDVRAAASLRSLERAYRVEAHDRNVADDIRCVRRPGRDLDRVASLEHDGGAVHRQPEAARYHGILLVHVACASGSACPARRPSDRRCNPLPRACRAASSPWAPRASSGPSGPPSRQRSAPHAQEG